MRLIFVMFYVTLLRSRLSLRAVKSYQCFCFLAWLGLAGGGGGESYGLCVVSSCWCMGGLIILSKPLISPSPVFV